MSKELCALSIKDLLSSSGNYAIPMYQRNYAWDEGEITQLIQDVIDCCDPTHIYYVGTLVVYERPDKSPPVFEIIDGQQRLTTLSLLTSYLKKTSRSDVPWYTTLHIQFDSRKHSSKTLEAIFEGEFNYDPAEVLDEKQINTAILNGYRLIQRILPQKLKENNVQSECFAKFLFNRVKIIRVKVPHDTDLNHYFEIMNSRGEQLEKHEVLKAQLMAQLQGCQQSQQCLHVVWEACANMERYVQLGFTLEQRKLIFCDQNWWHFKVCNFDDLRSKLVSLDQSRAKPDEAEQSMNLVDIIANRAGVNDEKAASGHTAPERFNTVINFSNFLLHVLRVQSGEDIPLDDKRLLDTFKVNLLDHADSVTKVKTFVFCLLRCKFLFDHCIIKREFIKGSDRWSLKRFKLNKKEESNSGNKKEEGYYANTFVNEDRNDDEIEKINRRIIMLLSAFHVSTPTQVYKHWLNAALRYLFYAKQIEAHAYLKHMESVAKAFVFDRFLAQEAGLEYFTIIYDNAGECKTPRQTLNCGNLAPRLEYGNIENNLVFNFLDYLLWLNHGACEPIKSYEFTFRSSVEHYYPRTPLQGQEELDPSVLNSFGNLCLISHDKNSQLSRFTPKAKKEFYDKNTIDSVKQYLMMKVEPWDADAINEHYNEMVRVFLSCFD